MRAFDLDALGPKVEAQVKAFDAKVKETRKETYYPIKRDLRR